MFCKYCGKELKDDAEFCPYCGKKQNPDDTTQTGKNAEQVSPVQMEENAEQISPAQTEENAEHVSPEQTEGEGKEKQDSSAQTTDKSTKTNEKHQKTKGLNPGQKKFLSRNRAIIAIVVVIAVAVVSIVAVTRNSGGTYETAVTKDGISYTAKTMWVVGEGPKRVGSSSKGKTAPAKQIDTIMDNYEESRQTIDPNGGRADASYRMFELLCVIAEELDESDKYAYAAADSASKRYKEMDDGIKYENIQEVNGLYRCVEMLAYIMAELGGEESYNGIGDIMEQISYTEPDTENFWECQGEATSVMIEYLYMIMEELNLPYETGQDIDYVYQDWTGQKSEIIDQDIYVQYNAGERQYVEGFPYIYQLLDTAVSGWDIASEYADDISEIEDDYEEVHNSYYDNSIENYTEEEIERDLPYLTRIMQCCTSMLAILARSLA